MGETTRAGGGKVSRTACAPVLIRGGIDERTGESLPASAVAVRTGWCAAIVQEMTGRLLEEHWNAADVTALASGTGPDGRPLPTMAWMALRRLGWTAEAPDGITVNDRVRRMAQEQAGRTLRAAAWRVGLTNAVLATWPDCSPGKRTAQEWDAVRAAVPGGDEPAI